MSSLGAIQTYIGKRLIDPNGTAVSANDITEAVNDAVRYWKYKRFWFNEVYDSASLTANNASFPYPSDFLCPAIQDGGFVIEFGNIRYPLSKIEKPVYDNLYIANCLGLPRWYARMADQEYQCFPIPNLAYVIKRHYLKDYDDLTQSPDTNDFTDNADRMIKLWALANLTQEFRQDSEQASYFRSAALDEWENLKRMNSKANAAGKLVLHSNL